MVQPVFYPGSLLFTNPDISQAGTNLKQQNIFLQKLLFNCINEGGVFVVVQEKYQSLKKLHV